MHANFSNPVNPRFGAERACCSPKANSFGMMQMMTALMAQLFSRSSGGLLTSGMPSFGRPGGTQSGLDSFLGGPQLSPTSAGGSGGGSRQPSIGGAAPTGATLTTTNSRSPKVSQQSDVPVPCIFQPKEIADSRASRSWIPGERDQKIQPMAIMILAL